MARRESLAQRDEHCYVPHVPLYLQVKRRIGGKGKVQNVPDGYLIDLTAPRPRLYVVEAELKAHDPLRHIAVQILQFSLSFETEKHGIKAILFNALQERPECRKKCQQYATKNKFRNLDHLLEHLVFEAPFAALVIIDELPEDLESVLIEKFKFGVEVIELARYENGKEYLYRFEPFLEEVLHDVPIPETDQVDAVVVPARADGVQEVFLGEDRWYAVRIHGTMRPQIKHIALYQVAPLSAITHVAPVKSIEPWKNTGKCVVNFASSAKKIGPIQLVKGGRVKAL